MRQLPIVDCWHPVKNKEHQHCQVFSRWEIRFHWEDQEDECHVDSYWNMIGTPIVSWYRYVYVHRLILCSRLFYSYWRQRKSDLFLFDEEFEYLCIVEHVRRRIFLLFSIVNVCVHVIEIWLSKSHINRKRRSFRNKGKRHRYLILLWHNDHFLEWIRIFCGKCENKEISNVHVNMIS